ncbi:hypothetical protein SAMN02746089_01891 [Caldanaerobius fijiensis DSM 17918]|uniref:Type IV pilus assembly protein PilO n=1 Tax=Caldanaerobius fijiensis DSM 17918 TaxID=1121256 RepID=A0A1M5BJI3_9THEO|nr:type 4a pilus biogenesis protein PilO [Caldanaerobius fijiensis]SHF42743.1 hypothetical protein SAMN02746089_01891 [Caldanaerobius fijiensis DSM 17918]
MIKDVLKDKKRLVLYAVAAAGAVVMLYLFSSGMNRLKTAEANYNSVKAQVQAQMARASVLVSAKNELANVKKQWDSIKQPYVINAEGGSFYDELGTLAEKYKIKDISITPQPVQNGFHNGHLRAVPYELEIKGPFPNVFNLMAGLEKLKTPAEIKPISIQQQDSGMVSVKATVFLYSLNPPEIKEFVNGVSGRYDPFFNPEIQKAVQKSEQANGTQVSAQTNNVTNTQTNNTTNMQTNSTVSTQTNNAVNAQTNTVPPNNGQTATAQQNNTQAANTSQSNNAQTGTAQQNNPQASPTQPNNVGTAQTVPQYQKQAN